MTKKIYILSLIISFTTSLSSQVKSVPDEIIFITEVSPTNIDDSIFIDSLAEANNFKLVQITTDYKKSDSLFTAAPIAIRITQRWQKSPSMRHCHGDWTTGLVWTMTSRLQIKKEADLYEFKLDHPIDKKQVNKIINSHETLKPTSNNDSKIVIVPHSFGHLTKSYRDSIANEFGKENVFSMVDPTSLMLADKKSKYLYLESVGVFSKEILLVEYVFLEPSTKRIIRKEKRSYGIK